MVSLTILPGTHKSPVLQIDIKRALHRVISCSKSSHVSLSIRHITRKQSATAAAAMSPITIRSAPVTLNSRSKLYLSTFKREMLSNCFFLKEKCFYTGNRVSCALITTINTDSSRRAAAIVRFVCGVQRIKPNVGWFCAATRALLQLFLFTKRISCGASAISQYVKRNCIMSRVSIIIYMRCAVG